MSTLVILQLVSGSSMVIQYLISKLPNMIFMREESLFVVALLASVRTSWKVTIYYINRALFIPNRAALYTSDFVTMWTITEKDTGIASLKSNAVWHNRSGTRHFWKRVLISPYMTNSAIYPSLKSTKNYEMTWKYFCLLS